MNLMTRSPEPAANAPRYAEGSHGHVESYFLRANDPDRPRALWIKGTILAPHAGEPLAETWFIWFDGEKKRTFARKETVPLREAVVLRSEGDAVELSIARTRVVLGASGSASGQMEDPAGDASWSLDFRADPSPVGGPLVMLPWRFLREGPFPRSKLLTPFPALQFTGRLSVLGETIAIDRWPGMQGHNWGREHAFEYAWGQCLFPATGAGPEAMVEGFSARVKLRSTVSPRMSALVVRRGAETYRFDRIFDFWRQRATIDRWRWTATLTGSDGSASLTMDAGDMPIACLGYRNPDGHLSYCFNTKLAAVWLQVEPRSGARFQLESAHGGALELLRHEPDPRIKEIV